MDIRHTSRNLPNTVVPIMYAYAYEMVNNPSTRGWNIQDLGLLDIYDLEIPLFDIMHDVPIINNFSRTDDYDYYVFEDPDAFTVSSEPVNDSDEPNSVSSLIGLPQDLIEYEGSMALPSVMETMHVIIQEDIPMPADMSLGLEELEPNGAFGLLMVLEQESAINNNDVLQAVDEDIDEYQENHEMQPQNPEVEGDIIQEKDKENDKQLELPSNTEDDKENYNCSASEDNVEVVGQDSVENQPEWPKKRKLTSQDHESQPKYLKREENDHISPHDRENHEMLPQMGGDIKQDEENQDEELERSQETEDDLPL